ncbi:DUF4435 domain-containing protein [Exiguobacterium sp. s50]|uniref:DUF4435 domain-containing protein n=1 Tax=Exiguobacterium sp. s50 TaxID=2751234 RepID=UPI001BEB3A84|nr:DUF4435 domain-containing protein [Exiguobacterium sp. s50]
MIFKKVEHGIIEDVDAILNETLFDAKRREDNFLVVEGKDDITVLENYFSLHNSNLYIRVISANSEVDDENDVAGKRNALTKYSQLKEENRKAICLLDRDWDFLIDNREEDQHVYYYDFFELENYLFEDSVFKKYLTHVFEVYEDFEIGEVFREVLEYEKAAISLYKAKLIKEHHTKTNSLTDVEWELFKSLGKLNHDAIMNRNYGNLKNLHPFDKINAFITDKLNEIDWDYEKLDLKLCEHNIYLDYFDSQEALYAFKYFVKGKDGPRNMGYILSKLSQKNSKCRFISSSNQASLRTLFLEWIPHYSLNFRQLVVSILNAFEEMKEAS